MLYFNSWLAPALVKPTFYIGSAACLLWGLYLIVTNSPTAVRKPGETIYYPADWHLVGIGWLWVIVGPLSLRLVCESISALFRLLELAETDKAETVGA